MITSELAFSKRKEGKVDEAYSMALELMKKPAKGEWDIRAIAWCVIDIIKRDAQLGQQQNLPKYADQIKNLEINPTDKALTDQKKYALELCAPTKENQTTRAWEIYRIAKAMTEEDPANYVGAKKHINDYLGLNTEKPSQLHSQILWLANKISKAKENNLNMGAFVRLWDLSHLQPEDYKQNTGKDGTPYPSLAEQVINQAAKSVLKKDVHTKDLEYIFPFIDNCINRYPDNIWLKLNKCKILIAKDKSKEALQYALEVVKNKGNDYWAWELLGDIHQPNAPDITLSCYCKALLCSKEIKFVAKVKVKLAELLSQREWYAEAKFEIEEVVNYRIKNNQKILEGAELLKGKSWYKDTTPTISNKEFYKNNISLAEGLLYSELPWINGVLGGTFCVGEQKNKPRRTIYTQSSDLPIEIAIPESRISLDVKQPGVGVKIKGEYDTDNRFQVYVIKNRDTEKDWDIFDEMIGVVSRINIKENRTHFIVNKTIGGVLLDSDLSSKFNEGDAIAVRMSKYITKQGKAGHNVITSNKTNQPVPESLLKIFEGKVTWKNGMGFTEDNIFIPPYLDNNNASNEDYITGIAILNYNKKQEVWGWKAIKINIK